MIGSLKMGIVALGLATASTVCAAPPAAHRGAHHYIYYPAQRLYFAPETQMWFWPEGDSWSSGGALPVPYQQYTRDGYNVYLDVERPYEAQQEVTAGHRRHRWTPYHYGDGIDGDPRHSQGGAGK
jgi:hypothetical protein